MKIRLHKRLGRKCTSLHFFALPCTSLHFFALPNRSASIKCTSYPHFWKCTSSGSVGSASIKCTSNQKCKYKMHFLPSFLKVHFLWFCWKCKYKMHFLPSFLEVHKNFMHFQISKTYFITRSGSRSV